VQTCIIGRLLDGVREKVATSYGEAKGAGTRHHAGLGMGLKVGTATCWLFYFFVLHTSTLLTLHLIPAFCSTDT
jgi:hypothetical protein